MPKRIDALVLERIVEVCGSLGDIDDEEMYPHTLFRSEQMAIFGCGSNNEWQALGRHAEDVLIPQRVLLTENVCSISCGKQSSGAVNASRTKIMCWGSNVAGMLAHGLSFDELQRSGPVAVIGLMGKIGSFYAGYKRAIVLTTSARDSTIKKTVLVWGSNEWGQQGRGGRVFPSPEAVNVAATPVAYFAERGIEISKVACGFNYCAAITANAALFMWGWNGVGICGVGSREARITIPTTVLFAPTVRCLDICCSRCHNLAICEEGEFGAIRKMCYSWGYGISGNLGHDEYVHESVPKEILFFSRQEENFSVFEIGVGEETSYCLVKKTFYHLNDLTLQEEKLELLMELEIM